MRRENDSPKEDPEKTEDRSEALKGPEGSNDKPEETSKTPEGDASRGEVAIYAFGNIEGAVADHVPTYLSSILVVTAYVNPMLLGLAYGIKTLWDGITDPIMASITDNTKSRYGRRRPYILIGGVLRILFLIAFVYFMPRATVLPNAYMEHQKVVSENCKALAKDHEAVVKSFEQLPEADPETQKRILSMLSGQVPAGLVESIKILFNGEKDTSMVGKAELAMKTLNETIPYLEEELFTREKEVADQKALLANSASSSKEAIKEQAILNTRLKDLDKVKNLIRDSHLAQSQAIAIIAGTRYLINTYGEPHSGAHISLEETQIQAQRLMEEAGTPVIPVFELEEKPAPKRGKPKGSWEKLKDGFIAFNQPENASQRTLVLYFLVGILIFTTLTTMNSVAYHALGIELSPSYDGRTQVVVYKSIMNKIAGIAQHWVPVLCFSLLFQNAFDGLFYVMVGVAIIGIPSTLLMFFKTRERTHAIVKKSGDRPNIFKTIWQISKNPDFLRILFLFVFIGLTNGLFAAMGFYLNVYWVMGSALSGATLIAWISMLAWVLGFLSLPIINWGCRKFQKHNLLKFAIIWMAIGTALKWWALNPEHPEYQFILPFFFSVGISMVYTVLPTMLADATDSDELRYGLRREGMFGAVNAFLMKLIGTLTPVLAGALLVASGFQPELEGNQSAQTITNMRLMYSLVPAVMLLFALVALWKYPLTRERVFEIKEILKKRHEAEKTQNAI
ncbi:MAG: MFS transporter [Verrucomicrobiales bacterium]